MQGSSGVPTVLHDWATAQRAMRSTLICVLCGIAVAVAGLPHAHAFVLQRALPAGAGGGALAAPLSNLQGMRLPAAHRRRDKSPLELKAGTATHKVVSNASARTALVLTQWKSNLKENSHRVAQAQILKSTLNL